MKAQMFERLLALNPDILREAEAAAEQAIAVVPPDLQAEEEPAHVFSAEPSQARGGDIDE